MNFWKFTIGNTLIGVHTTAAPTDEQWDDVVATLKSMGERFGFASLRILVFTDGGAPSSVQRERLNQLLTGQPVRAAVVSGSSLVRGVVTAFGWFNPQFKSFAPNRVRDALAHLGLTDITMFRDQLRSISVSVEALNKAFLALDQPEKTARS